MQNRLTAALLFAMTAGLLAHFGLVICKGSYCIIEPNLTVLGVETTVGSIVALFALYRLLRRRSL